MKAIETDTLTPYAASLAHVPYTGIRELGELAMSMDGVLRLYFGESSLPNQYRPMRDFVEAETLINEDPARIKRFFAEARAVAGALGLDLRLP